MKRLISAAAAILLMSGCAALPAGTGTAPEKITESVETASTVATETEAETTTTTANNLTVEVTGETTPEPKATDEYKALYGALLADITENGLQDSNSPMFDIYDLDSDGIPELFISYDDFHYSGVDIYTVSGGEAVNIGKNHGSWGEALVSGNYLLGGFSNMGASIEKIYEKTGDTLKLLVTLESMEVHTDTDEGVETALEYRVDEKTVSEEEYLAERKKYPDEWESVGRGYDLNKKNITLMFGEASDGYKALYKDLLCDVREIARLEDGSEFVRTRFDLYDLDSDGIPELFFSHGDLSFNNVSIYTVFNGELTDLTEKLGESTSLGKNGQVIVYDRYIENSYGYLAYWYYNFYTLEGGSLVKAACFDYKPADAVADNNAELYPDEAGVVYSVNDEFVTHDAFFDALSSYEDASAAMFIGRTYPADDKTLELLFG